MLFNIARGFLSKYGWHVPNHKQVVKVVAGSCWISWCLLFADQASGELDVKHLADFDVLGEFFGTQFVTSIMIRKYRPVGVKLTFD